VVATASSSSSAVAPAANDEVIELSTLAVEHSEPPARWVLSPAVTREPR
jgi:hypothetical protein